jgi:hypothetical protein
MLYQLSYTITNRCWKERNGGIISRFLGLGYVWKSGMVVVVDCQVRSVIYKLRFFCCHIQLLPSVGSNGKKLLTRTDRFRPSPSRVPAQRVTVGSQDHDLVIQYTPIIPAFLGPPRYSLTRHLWEHLVERDLPILRLA